MVEEDRSDIIQMPIERKKTSPGLIRPHLDLVVVTSGDEEWLCLMKINATNWPIMLLEPIDQRAHAVVP